MKNDVFDDHNAVASDSEPDEDQDAGGDPDKAKSALRRNLSTQTFVRFRVGCARPREPPFQAEFRCQRERVSFDYAAQCCPSPGRTRTGASREGFAPEYL